MFQIERAAFGVSGKKAHTVKFKRGSSGQKKSFIGGGAKGRSVPMVKVDGDDSIRFVLKKDGLSLSSQTQPFSPVNALKSIAKSILLLSIPHEIRTNLDHVRKWTVGEEKSSGPIRWAKIFMPGPSIDISGVALLEQKSDMSLPTYLALFFFRNLVVALSLPEKDFTHLKPLLPPVYVFPEIERPILNQFVAEHDAKVKADISMSFKASQVHQLHFERQVLVMVETISKQITATLDTQWFEKDNIVWQKYCVQDGMDFQFDIIVDRSAPQLTAEINVQPGKNSNDVELATSIVESFHNDGHTFTVSLITEHGAVKQLIDFSRVTSTTGLGAKLLID